MRKTKILNPKRIRRKEISCSVCQWAKYSRRDYKILYESKRLAFFEFPMKSKNIYCHDCLVKMLASQIKEGETSVKVKVIDIAEEYIISVEQE